MPEDNRGAPASKGNKSGADRRGGRPGGDKRGNKRGGSGGRPTEQSRAETYETVKEVTRGPDFKIDKSIVADKATHKPMRVEYRLTRQGLTGTQMFSRLADAITASTAPLPEPEPEAVNVEAGDTEIGDAEIGAAEVEHPAEDAEPEVPAEVDLGSVGGEH